VHLRLKRGLILYPGASHAGRVTVAPIGIPATFSRIGDGDADRAEWVRSVLPERVQSRDANKGRFGTVLVIAGSAGMAGAATLTGLSALRAGAGLVHLALPASVLDTAAVLAPELVLHALPETPERSHGGEGALERVLELAEKADAVAIGPGLSGNTVTKTFVQTFVQQLSAQKPLVIDADGLNAVADGGDELFAHRTGAHTLLTPHPGEAGRLLARETGTVQAERAKAVRELAQKYRATVLLKGASTLIATNENEVHLYINRSGSVTLATAGSGDVLTGVLAALLADRENGLSATDAARAGAFLHALAGEQCEKKQGTVGTIATEIRDALPKARRILYNEVSEGSLNHA
jgi:NAD(P)H-hydrate epimerase